MVPNKLSWVENFHSEVHLGTFQSGLCTNMPVAEASKAPVAPIEFCLAETRQFTTVQDSNFWGKPIILDNYRYDNYKMIMPCT